MVEDILSLFSSLYLLLLASCVKLLLHVPTRRLIKLNNARCWCSTVIHKTALYTITHNSLYSFAPILPRTRTRHQYSCKLHTYRFNKICFHCRLHFFHSSPFSDCFTFFFFINILLDAPVLSRKGNIDKTKRVITPFTTVHTDLNIELLQFWSLLLFPFGLPVTLLYKD